MIFFKRENHAICVRVGNPALDTKTTTAPTVPRWNYKKADWKAYSHRSSILTNGILNERDINKVIKEFSTGILQAAKECIPKGARKDYKPYWSDELENKHKALSDARKIAKQHGFETCKCKVHQDQK